MLGTLLKKELSGLGNTLANSGKNAGRRKNGIGTKLLLGFVLIYLVGFMGFLFYNLAEAFCEPFAALGIEWAYFAIMGVMSLTFCIIGGAMTAYSTIYKAKDNEFLLSLPIRPSLILSTRVLICYTVDFVINLVITLMAFAVYEIHFSLTFAMIVGGIVILFIFPLLGLVLSLLLGWLIGVATSKVPEEKKSYVSLAFVFLFLIGYFVLYSKMMDIMEIIVNSKDAVAGFLEKYIKPVFWMGEAATGDWISILLLTVVSIAAFAIVYMILSSSFIKVITTTKGRKRVKYKETQLKTSDSNSALLGREFLHFRRNTTIMVNFGLSLLLLAIMGVALIVLSGKASEVVGMMGLENTDILMLAGLGILLYILSMCPITAPSISLEASTLWLIRSLPIPTRDILSAKLKEHLYLTIPASMIGMAGIIVVAKPSVLIAVLSVLCVIVYNFFMATWGLRLNIIKPSFNWTNEAAAVKRSASVTICMLGSMGIVMTLVVIYAIFGERIPAEIFIGAVTVIFALIAFVNYRWILTKGIDKFESL
jgi:ABC-2 type transport system permease protein